MNIIFRADASLDIGTGHVMRCLTLAKALRGWGVTCRFVCREHAGNLIDLIRQYGFDVQALPMQDSSQQFTLDEAPLAHANWLGADWKTDVKQTKLALGQDFFDWMIVDHYALDARWEKQMKSSCRKLMVIDDIADRQHECDLLLDQNLIQGMEQRYQDKVPKNCVCLIGPMYALLRDEFVNLRAASLLRRESPDLNRLIVFMGGSDASNETSKVISGIKLAQKKWVHIDVVVGGGYPYLASLQKNVGNLPSTIHVQTSEMASLMAMADLAITAGGSVTWEKCVLGLPSLIVTLAKNQQPIANMMHDLGVLKYMGVAESVTPDCYAAHIDKINVSDLQEMASKASAVCDGLGISKILDIIGTEG